MLAIWVCIWPEPARAGFTTPRSGTGTIGCPRPRSATQKRCGSVKRNSFQPVAATAYPALSCESKVGSDRPSRGLVG